MSPASAALPGAVRTGVLAAIGTWGVVVILALVGWLAAPESSLGWFSAVQVGSAIWFLGHGQSIGTGELTISLTPVLLFLVFVLVSVRWLRALVLRERAAVSTREWSRVAKVAVLPGFAAGYLAVGVVVSLLTLGAPVAPGAAAVLGVLVVPAVALCVVLVRPDEDDSPWFVRAAFRRGPTWLPSAWRVGWRGFMLLMGIGAVVVAARVVVSLGAILDVQQEYGLSLSGGLVAALAQAFLLGNSASWALGFLAGPGFQVAVGSTISPAAAHPGLMPLVPVLAGLPEEADYPPAMKLVMLVPVLVGVVVGSWVERELEFFGNWRARLGAVTTAGIVAVAGVAALAALGNGAIGVDRLRSIGVPVVPVAVMLTLEVLLGGALWVAWRAWRERAVDLDGAEADDAGAPVGESAREPRQPTLALPADATGDRLP